MTFDRVAIVERALDDYLAGAADAGQALAADAPIREGSGLTARQAIELFEDQVTSRALDVAARELKKTDRSFYTISSAGHENNAVLGATSSASTIRRSCTTAPAALMMARARQLPGMTPAFDALLGIVASSEDPIAQGRHKVWGSRPLWVPPQTSHHRQPPAEGDGPGLQPGPRAALGVGRRAARATRSCSARSATRSANHATALAAINTARYAARIGLPMPILFVCEDNGTGISVPTPDGWIARDLRSASRTCATSSPTASSTRSGTPSRTAIALRAQLAPAGLPAPARRCGCGAMPAATRSTSYRTRGRDRGHRGAGPAARATRAGWSRPAPPRPTSCARPGGATRASASWPRPRRPPRRPRLDDDRGGGRAAWRRTTRSRVAERAAAAASLSPRRAPRGRSAARCPERATNPNARTLAGSLNAALADELARRPELLVFGEDVGRKGGVYNVTNGLQRRFGAGRVFDTLLDETSILGIAQGAAHIGLLPVPEIQYLAYLHNALDQLRGEAASLQFFSSGQFRNPMVVRVPGLAYQKGFGGHFHNDNSVGALRDIPGLVLAVPGTRRRRGPHAARRDRHGRRGRAGGRLPRADRALPREGPARTDGDGGWLTDYPAPPVRRCCPASSAIYEADDRRGRADC